MGSFWSVVGALSFVFLSVSFFFDDCLIVVNICYVVVQDLSDLKSLVVSEFQASL